jgi:hypothetical protein
LLLLPGRVLAAAPVVDDFSASSPVVLPGGVVTLTVTAHDPDCPDTCTSGCGQYIRADLTSWSASGGTFLSEDDGTSGSPYTASADWQAPETEDVYTISVQLSDSGSFLCGGRQTITANLDIQVTTSNNQPPVIDSLTADPAQLFPGQDSDLLCSASDPDGDPASYTWATDSGAVTPGAGGSATFTAGEPAVATVTCTATDSGGLFAQDTIVISVVGAVADSAVTSGLVTPLRLDVDSSGNLYVVDRAAGGISVVGLFSGELVYRLPMEGVTSVAVDWNDDLLVGGEAGVGLVDRSGSPISGVGFGNPLGDVADVAVDRTNLLYGVLHRRAGRVIVYDQAGSQLLAFGSTGDGPDQFKSPQGLAVTPSGQWVVGDTGHGLIKVFDANGILQTSFGGIGGGAGEFVRLDDVAVDAAGVIYASDRFQDWILAFNPDGSLREAIGSYGDGVGQFETAAGVATADAFDRLLGASVNSSSIQVFRTSDDPVVPLGPAVPDLVPGSLAYADQATGTESDPQPLTLSNTGQSILGLREVDVQGDFLQTNDCGPFVDPGQSCTLQVAFRPSAAGPRTGALVVDTNGDPARRAASLSGSGFLPLPGVGLAPGLLVFGDQQVGTVSAPLPVTLANVGLAPLDILSIDVSDQYLESNDCVSPLGAGASCTILVRFAPTIVADSLPGALGVTSDAEGSPHVVSLDGRSTPVVPLIAIDDPTLDEGDDGDLFEAVFTVTLSEPTTETVTVDYATAPDTAEADVDYESVSGSLTFLPGETTRTLPVVVIGDGILEVDEETFFVMLEAPVGGVIDAGVGLATIFDDEPCFGPNLVLNPSAEARPDGAGVPDWAAESGTWQRRDAPPTPVDGDYYFYPTTTDYAELVQEIDVSAYAERIDTDRQWFGFDAWARTLYEAPTDTARIIVEYQNADRSLVLDTFDSGEFSSPGLWLNVVDERPAPIGTRWIRIRLISNYLGDAYFDAVALHSLRVATVVVDDTEEPEGDAGFSQAMFSIRMACPFSEEVRVDYATTDQSALAGEDYLTEVGTLILPVGTAEGWVAISVIGDETDEPHETFGLSLGLVEPTDALLLDDLGVCVIRNDDFCPQVPGYWRDNPALWPANWLELGGREYDKPELLALLDYSGSDVSHLLARELIATKLNLLQGSDPSIEFAVDRADNFLAPYPPGSRPTGKSKRRGSLLVAELETYNSQVCP